MFREIKFREINEIKGREKITDQCKKEDHVNSYQRIKPKTNITTEEADEFWRTIFLGQKAEQ